ncbi:MAG: hypothetical protein HZC41_13370 [Chloroflexi bacterium]|nr:hypothetical protein [Chloroflexota bacterium]
MSVRKALVLVSLLFVFNFMTTPAQEDVRLEYGQLVNGEITDRAFEVPYLISGKAGDVIVIEMKPVDSLGDLDSPEIILLNSDNDVIADTSGQFSVSGAVLVTQLPNDGDFTVLATRSDGRSGDSVGEYTLEVIKPETLTSSQLIAGSASSEKRDQYYLIEDSESPLELVYIKGEGDFTPEITINEINEDFGLSELITIGGDALSVVRVNVPENKQNLIVVLKEALWDFYFDEATVEYEIGVEPQS